MTLLMAVRPLLPESGLHSVLQLAQPDTASTPDAWLRALAVLLRRDVGIGVSVEGTSPLSPNCQSQLRDLCGRLGQGGRGLKLAPTLEDQRLQLRGKRRKEPKEDPASPESERAPKRFRGLEEEEEDQEERPKLESRESPLDAGGVSPDPKRTATEVEMPEIGPGVEEAKGPVERVELPKIIQVLWLEAGFRMVLLHSGESWLRHKSQQGPLYMGQG